MRFFHHDVEFVLRRMGFTPKAYRSVCKGNINETSEINFESVNLGEVSFKFSDDKIVMIIHKHNNRNYKFSSFITFMEHIKKFKK